MTGNVTCRLCVPVSGSLLCIQDQVSEQKDTAQHVSYALLNFQ